MTTFIDLFAGIGGFHLALNNAGAHCVFVSEWDKHARTTYQANFTEEVEKLGDNFASDITEIDPQTIPDFDILCAGFPCQPFSNAGKKQGFADTRGTLFFNIAKIIETKKPQAFILENVRGLLNHDNGNTFETIKKTLTEDLGYSFFYKVLKASDHGVPQNRPRLFMVGFRDTSLDFAFPEATPLQLTMSQVFQGSVPRDIGFTLRVGGRGSPINDRRNWDSYLVDGEVRRITAKEGLKMQGFPDTFTFPVSETQAMKQLGNSVAVPVVQAVAQQVIGTLDKADNIK